VEPSPAGAVASTATDMAKLMLAHLNNGALDGHRILAESTAVRMHSRAFGHDPRLPGFAPGFYEKSSHGLRIIGHGGDARFVPLGHLLYRDELGEDLMAFQTDAAGHVVRGFLGEAPTMGSVAAGCSSPCRY